MTREEKIRALSKGYGPSLQRRLEQMSDYQLAAVYERKLSAGELN